MIFTTLLSFLGGNVFRMIFGEVVSFLNKKQDHEMEIQRMQIQAKNDADAHARNMEALQVQAQIGKDIIHAQSEAVVTEVEANAFLEAVKATAIKTGIMWIDGWNAVIRPGVATWSIIMMTLAEIGAIHVLSDGVAQITGCALGIYLADRSLMKRGK